MENKKVLEGTKKTVENGGFWWEKHGKNVENRGNFVARGVISKYEKRVAERKLV